MQLLVPLSAIDLHDDGRNRLPKSLHGEAYCCAFSVEALNLALFGRDCTPTMIPLQQTLYHKEERSQFWGHYVLEKANLDDLVKSEAPRPQGGACGALAGQNSMVK